MGIAFYSSNRNNHFILAIEETKPMNIRQKQNLKHKRLKESKNNDETNNANEDKRIMKNTNNRLKCKNTQINKTKKPKI